MLLLVLLQHKLISKELFYQKESGGFILLYPDGY